MRPRRLLAPTVIAPLAVLAAVALQFSPALRGRVYRFEDIAGYFEPLWTAAARAMHSGWGALRAGAWDAGAWSGQPLAGDPQVGLFYPLNWLWLLLPVLRAYALAAMLHAALAGFGMYALARVRGRSPAASAMAGIALGVGGFVVLQVRHIMFVEATAWIPWVGFFAVRFLERRRRADLAQAALSSGLLLLTGGVSMIYYGLWFLAALLLPRALSTRAGAARSGFERGGLLTLLCITASLGVLLAAPSWLPAAAHGRLSPRALGTEYEFTSSIAWGGLHYLPSLFIPNLLGQQVRGNYVGGGTQWEIAGYYAGVLPFALALFALFAGPRARRAERIAFSAIFLLAVLLAPGAHSPLHRLAYRMLPLYGSMRCPPRALYVFSLGVPLLGADGLDLALARLRRILHRNNASTSTERRLAVIAGGAVALVALDLLVTHRAENPAITLDEAHSQAFPQAVDFLRRHAGDRYVNDVHLSHDLHNSGLLWGLENASGYSSLPLWRYLHLLWIGNHGRVYPHPRLHDDLAAQGIWRFDAPLVDLLAVRWVLAAPGRGPRAPGYVKRAAGRAGPWAEPIDVWENTEAGPRAFLLARAVEVDGAAEAATVVAASQRGVAAAAQHQRDVAAAVDLRREAVLERRADAALRLDGPAAEPAPVALDGPTAWEREARFEAPAPRLLVFAEPYHPGWRATLDGAPVPAEPADYALVGVRVPAGRHTVRLVMRAPEVERGLALAALALAGIAALALGGRRRP